jgi:hypothetical protein
MRNHFGHSVVYCYLLFDLHSKLLDLFWGKENLLNYCLRMLIRLVFEVFLFFSVLALWPVDK